MANETTPVLIVGAGLAGLSAAVFLGLHGVSSLLVERHPGTSRQPKARGQAPATMEALRTAGVADDFVAAAPSGEPGMRIVITPSVAGQALHDFANDLPGFESLSGEPYGGVSQERAEVILARRATQLGADIRFSTRMESFHDDEDGVTAVVRGPDGDGYQVRARYLVAADGHKGDIRDALGVTTHGRVAPRPTRTLFAQFEADLDRYQSGHAVALWYVQNPDLPGGSATVVSTDHPGRYVIALADEQDTPDARCVELIRTAVGVSDLAVTVTDRATTSSGTHIVRVADSFVAGKVLLVGDAAHLMPPTGGQGGNLAIMDGFHLAWKLAAVLNGSAGPRLLDSHDAERRPLADAYAEQQYANMVQRHAPELRDESVAELLDPATLLFGYQCPAGAFVAEPTPAPLFRDPTAPGAPAGARAPHVPLLRSGTPISTRTLFGRVFVLLSGDEGEAWQKAGRAAAQRLGIELDGFRIGPGADLQDPNDAWLDAYGLAPSGGVLVRPDGLIAYRCRDEGGATGLEDALRTVLCQA